MREMGCTVAEFLRWLPGATRDAANEVNGSEATVPLGAGMVRLHFEQAPARTIALITLPVLKVSFRFSGLDANERRAFLDYFDLYTKRGGG
jgi:hypothetical protein